MAGGETLYGVAGPSGETVGGDQLNLAGILNTLDGVVDTPLDLSDGFDSGLVVLALSST